MPGTSKLSGMFVIWVVAFRDIRIKEKSASNPLSKLVVNKSVKHKPE